MQSQVSSFFKALIIMCVIVLPVLTLAQGTSTFKISGTMISVISGEPVADGAITIAGNKLYECDSVGHFMIDGLSVGQHKLSFDGFDYDDSKDTVVTISKKDIVDFTWNIYEECKYYNSRKAITDIRNKKPKILLQSGFGTSAYSTDKIFERKYQFSFQGYGCFAEDREECLVAYNKIIFEYLDKKYGKKWREEIREDAIGLKRN